MNTSFKPSEFDKQASASLDYMDEEAAAKRVQNILHPEYRKVSTESGEAALEREVLRTGPTLTSQPQTQPQAPAASSDRPSAQRKKRSDAGVPKEPPADPDEIVLHLTHTEARTLALTTSNHGLGNKIQDQIIAQLQKRLDTLTRQK